MTKLSATLSKTVFQQCFGLKPQESVLIVADKAKLKEARTLLQAAQLINSQAKILLLSGMTENAQEPPQKVSEAMVRADVALLVTTYSLSHTLARKKACQAGTRIASLPGITLDMITRTLTADYSQIAKFSRRLARILTQAKTAQLSSPAGTKLNFLLKGRAGMADDGSFTKKGNWGNLPAGEACIGPLEGKTNGHLVIDGAISDIELDKPITIEIKNGVAVKISGGQAAKIFQSQLQKAGPLAYQVAELGIGTNPLAKLSSDALEAEKVSGTCHVALGNNLSYGGHIDVPFHSDGIIVNPTLTIDDKIITL